MTWRESGVGRGLLPGAALAGAVALAALSVLWRIAWSGTAGPPVAHLSAVAVGALGGVTVARLYDRRERARARLREERAERETARRRLRHYRLAVESSTNLIAGLDRNYEIVFANRRFREFHGIDAEAVGDVTLRDVLPAEAFAAVRPHLEEALAGDPQEFALSRAGPDGREHHFSVRNYPLVDDDGEIAGIVAAMNDTTEERERRRELQAQRRRYQSLFESIPDAVVVADAAGEIVDANPAVEATFGYERDDLVGREIGILYADGRAIAESGDEQGQARTVAFEKRSGQVFEGVERRFPLRDPDDDPVGHVAIVRDVSDREMRLRQLRVLDRVLRHNISNEMNVIAGNAELIADRGSEAVADPARTIVAASERLVETARKEREITSFLSQSPQPTRAHVDETVMDAVAWARERYPEATIEADLPEGCTAMATDALERAVSELVENAIRHSDRESPSVRVGVDATEEIVSVTVADDGPGLPEMERAVLREDDVDPLYHGSGLGLWLVTLIARQSNGTVTHEENDPRGTEITLTLPRMGPDD